MGSCLSSRKRSHALSSADEVELLAQFKDLRMSMFLSEADFIKLYRYFLDANVNENGCINLTEFLGFFDLPRNRISKRAFDMFRDDNETGITFKQWVFAIWNFCTTDSSALSIFAFQLYDKTGKGTLDLDDITHMLHELFGRDYESNPLARELMKSLLETDYRGNRITAGVTAGQFAKVAVRARNLMYQAFKLQRAIQSKVFGIGHWADKTLEREELQRTGGLNLQQVLDLVNAGRRRAQGHVVRGGVIMPYVSAMGDRETPAERAERERLERLQEVVGAEQMSSMLGQAKGGGAAAGGLRKTLSLSPRGAGGAASAASTGLPFGGSPRTVDITATAERRRLSGSKARDSARGASERLPGASTDRSGAGSSNPPITHRASARTTVRVAPMSQSTPIDIDGGDNMTIRIPGRQGGGRAQSLGAGASVGGVSGTPTAARAGESTGFRAGAEGSRPPKLRTAHSDFRHSRLMSSVSRGVDGSSSPAGKKTPTASRAHRMSAAIRRAAK